MRVSEEEKENRKRKVRAAAALLLCCLLGGAAGSCRTYADILKTSDVEAGGTVTFGAYEQIEGQYGEEDLEWLVLEKEEDEGRALLITVDCIECMPYHGEKKEITWEDSSIRQWLNGPFLQEAFSEEELDQIVQVDVETRVNEEFDQEGSVTTSDRVFLLDDEEVRAYFPTKSDRMAHASEVIRDQLEEEDDSDSGESLKPAVSELSDAAFWWLRTPGDRQDCAECVGAEGSIVSAGYLVVQGNFGVRPALWVDLD